MHVANAVTERAEHRIEGIEIVAEVHEGLHAIRTAHCLEDLARDQGVLGDRPRVALTDQPRLFR